MGKAVASGSRSGHKCESGMEDELQHNRIKVVRSEHRRSAVQENFKLQPGGFSEGEFPSERS